VNIVVAVWQQGCSAEPKFKTAVPEEAQFKPAGSFTRGPTMSNRHEPDVGQNLWTKTPLENSDTRDLVSAK